MRAVSRAAASNALAFERWPAIEQLGGVSESRASANPANGDASDRRPHDSSHPQRRSLIRHTDQLRERQGKQLQLVPCLPVLFRDVGRHAG